MNRVEVIERIIATLEAQLATASAASLDAANYATDQESRAESKWDTQGLEASYLAAGQAEQASVIGEAIQALRSFLSELQVSSGIITAGSLVECDLNGYIDWFFLSPKEQ